MKVLNFLNVAYDLKLSDAENSRNDVLILLKFQKFLHEKLIIVFFLIIVFCHKFNIKIFDLS